MFFSVGSYENTEGDRRWRAQLPADLRAQAEADAATDPPYDSVADVEEMVDSLRRRRYPGLKVAYEVLPGEYHQTAPPLAVSRSLRYMFDAPR